MDAGELECLLVTAVREHGSRGPRKRGHPVGGLSVSEALLILSYCYGAHPEEEAVLEALERLEGQSRLAALDTIHVRWVNGPRGRRLVREPQLRWHLGRAERKAAG